MSTLKSIVESLLFVAEGPLTLDRLCSLLEEHERNDIRAALNTLLQDYGGEGRGVELAEVAGGYQFRTVAENADYLRRLTKVRPVRFSQSALESLAIIAYRQPVTRAEIEYLRGVDSGGVLKTLLEKKLIKILGKKDIPGKPLIYGTTREFLEVFDLKDLRSLPSLKEIRELSETSKFEQQEELPLPLPESETSAANNSDDTDA
ncbi:segregation and condensation protein B [Geotalea uraniireducens]|uniref:Segregation and condensation protein B n=1 Tax=Geotalea uraniireducens TaxID=351604 RepID=A0ABM8EMI1_9BACT|nr:SMC-Scp complex subunit ScpB [Geotalea uraniireducens]BDV43425.1 segregation and condensation protein B [Geotalea uraniireducens]